MRLSVSALLLASVARYDYYSKLMRRVAVRSVRPGTRALTRKQYAVRH